MAFYLLTVNCFVQEHHYLTVSTRDMHDKHETILLHTWKCSEEACCIL